MPIDVLPLLTGNDPKREITLCILVLMPTYIHCIYHYEKFDNGCRFCQHSAIIAGADVYFNLLKVGATKIMTSKDIRDTVKTKVEEKTQRFTYEQTTQYHLRTLCSNCVERIELYKLPNISI